MSNQKRVTRRPMLYIAQPEFKPAEVSMQTSYHTRNSIGSAGTSVQEKEMNQQDQTTETEDIKDDEVNEEPPQDQASSESKGKIRISRARERRERFKDLTLEGKVNYFFQLSPHVPKMKCEVSTEEEHYRGYINHYENGIVHMKTFQRPFQQEIPFIDIKDIRLIGF